MEGQMFQLRPRRKVLGPAGQPKGMGTPISRHTQAMHSLGMHNKNPDCMFFKLGNIIVHLCGYAGAASYVRETTVSRCQLFSNCDFQIIMEV